jgi:PBSX family phage portal protein
MAKKKAILGGRAVSNIDRQRRSLSDVLHSSAQKSEKERLQYSRQVDYDDIFDELKKEVLGTGISLLAPPYKPGRMYELYEQSAILSSCVEAYVHNIDGYGYNITSSVSDDDDKQTDSNPKVAMLKEFFNAPNDKESFDILRKKLRRDYEITGNSFLEVIRGKDNKPTLLFWVNAQRIRLTMTREPIMVKVWVKRGGSLVGVEAEKRFRSYCMPASDGATSGHRVRFFKEYGDPRIMDAETGRFDDNTSLERRASEIIHFKQGNGVYGIPRWIGALMSVMGGYKANLINYDLFDNQGIPPMIITVSGGSLTKESFDDLVSLFQKAKGAQNFHKVILLQAEGEPVGIEGRETVPHLRVDGMAQYRQEDAMFLRYLDFSRTEVQKLGFRLPGMFLGISDDANYATAYIVRGTAEEQIFVPERTQFDEIINNTLIQDLTDREDELRFKSNGPVLQSKDNVTGLVTTLVNSGVFTVNGLISFVNSLYGLNIALYDDNEAWANEPVPVAMELKQQVSVNTAEQKETPGGLDDEEIAALEKSQKISDALLEIERGIARNISNGSSVVAGAVHKQYEGCNHG